MRSEANLSVYSSRAGQLDKRKAVRQSARMATDAAYAEDHRRKQREYRQIANEQKRFREALLHQAQERGSADSERASDDDG